MNLRALALATGTALAILPATAPACGFEDPSSISMQRGMLQLAYPQALFVGTAVWQAQAAGTLPRDALAQQGDLSPEARARLRLLKANALLARFVARLNAAPVPGSRPRLAIVLLGPVMWSRVDAADGAAKLSVHVPGPEPGDVVAVTEIAVLEAFADGQIDAAGAVETGMLRLYGGPADVAATYDWLALATRG